MRNEGARTHLEGLVMIKEENDKIYTLENMGRESSSGWASNENEKENDKIYNVNDNCSRHGKKEIT